MYCKPATTITFILIYLLGCSPQKQAEKTDKPLNILMIVADDLGYTDIGAFGGDIETPNIDMLATTGLTFSRFHTAPVCAVTRSMLLSGTNNHIAGMGSQDLITQHFGYEGHLTNRIVPLPQLLRDAGYHTSMAGKWHLGQQPEHNPHAKGFEHSFVLLQGGGNHYTEEGLFDEDPISPYTEDGVKTAWPTGAYSTDLYTDKLVDFMGRYQDDEQPFFAFAAYTSPHWPLQVDEAYWKKYEGRYAAGYEVLRQERFESLKKKGLIPAAAALPALHPSVKPWDSLSLEEQKKESRKMELYAGMVDNLDYNIGRLIAHLKSTGQYENTLIIFFSDNGAAANDFYRSDSYGPFLQAHYTEDYDKMGTAESFISYGPQWAEAGAAPFKYFKGYTTEGGTNTPFIISGPIVKKVGTTPAFTSLLDIAPTLYELAGINYPQQYNGKPIYPLEGESMKPFLENNATVVHDENYVFAMEHRGDIVVRQGDWKLVNSVVPFDENNFELYDLSKDSGEQHNVKTEFPEKYEVLLREWQHYKDRVKVVLPTPEPGSAPEE